MFDERLAFYDLKVDPSNSNNPLTKFIHLIGPQKRVLEVGCATGFLSKYLTRQLRCQVVGIELNPEAARLAKQHCEDVIVGDVEKDALDKAKGLFDVITFGDVLEHLISPGVVLRRCKNCLALDGYILTSIPNVAHWSIRGHLMRGKFNYQKGGILDRTHLRFFTLRTARRMIEEAGYDIVHSDIVYALPGMKANLSSKRLERFLKKHFAGLIGVQFIFKAVSSLCNEDRREHQGSV